MVLARLFVLALFGAVVGSVATTAPCAAKSPGSVVLKAEWIESGHEKRSESVVLRAVFGEKSTIRQGVRTLEATPEMDGRNITVHLRVADASGAPEELTTDVHTEPGETCLLTGTTKKEGKESRERLLFLTATPL